jgi:hypothetical protein
MRNAKVSNPVACLAVAYAKAGGIPLRNVKVSSTEFL